jgi:uncharacterized membrane protein YhaH (DUF805 family)
MGAVKIAAISGVPGPVPCLKVDAVTSTRKRTMMLPFQIDPLIAAGVFVATAATDGVYVMFTAAVVARRRLPAATWSSVWYLLSSFAVISYTSNWIYVGFAALGSWVGAFATITFLHRTPNRPPPLGTAPQPPPASVLRAAGYAQSF